MYHFNLSTQKARHSKLLSGFFLRLFQRSCCPNFRAKRIGCRMLTNLCVCVCACVRASFNVAGTVEQNDLISQSVFTNGILFQCHLTLRQFCKLAYKPPSLNILEVRSPRLPKSNVKFASLSFRWQTLHVLAVVTNFVVSRLA